jgi:alcohol dehydrogenase class IV
MLVPNFAFLQTPKINFGIKALSNLFYILQENKVNNIILVTGSNSLKRSGKMECITSIFKSNGIEFHHITVTEEPTVEFIDENVEKFHDKKIDFVISIGGGSVIDTGKALSAMLLLKDSVINYLDVVGTKKHSGQKISFIAIPTTAGTGSEATNNAVISKKGINGFKRSLRHNNFVPDYAIVDPELTLTQPPNVSAFSGLDAFTQLLESFVSVKSTPISDALCESGVKYFNYNLIRVCTGAPGDVNARSCLSYGALLSGITLTNAGLGIVHGFASEIGGLFIIPHGAICAALLPAATRVNIDVLKRDTQKNILLLEKYAKIGKLLNKDKYINEITSYCNLLVDKLYEWREVLKVPQLGTYGLNLSVIPEIVKRVGQKNNPVKLSNDELELILKLSI